VVRQVKRKLYRHRLWMLFNLCNSSGGGVLATSAHKICMLPLLLCYAIGVARGCSKGARKGGNSQQPCANSAHRARTRLIPMFDVSLMMVIP